MGGKKEAIPRIMAPEISVYTTPPEALVELLTRSPHVPHALPLARRMRFTRVPGGITEHARILWAAGVSLEDHIAGGGNPDAPFAAAYLDFSRGPETELWIYSSLETRSNANAELRREDTACAVALLRRVKRLQDLYFTPGSARATEREFPTILVGNLAEALRTRLVEAGLDIFSTGLYDKFIFNVDELPDVRLPDVLGAGDGRRLRWDRLRPEDIPFAISRSHIPRKE